MKKQGLQLMTTLLLAVFYITTSHAQGSKGLEGFQGVIEFTKATTFDTTSYVYYVKGDMIRIDEITSDKKIAGILIVNTKTYKSTSLSPDRQVYMELKSGNSNLITIKDVEIIKGKQTKTIAGYKCKEVVVKNKEQNTQITYYLAKDNFHFFEGMLLALNRKDKFSTYFQQLSDVQNTFPFRAIETDLNGKARGSLNVVKVTKKDIEDYLFEIPDGYTKFEK